MPVGQKGENALKQAGTGLCLGMLHIGNAVLKMVSLKGYLKKVISSNRLVFKYCLQKCCLQKC